MIFKNIYYLLKVISSYLRQISTIALIFFLSAEEYGMLAVIISLSQLIYTISCGITNGAQLNIGSKIYKETGQYTNIVMYRYAIVFLHFFACILFLYLLSNYLNSLFEVDMLLLFVISLSIGYVLYETGTQLLYPSKYFSHQVSIEFLVNLSLLAAVIFFIRSLESFVIAFVAISATSAIAAIYIFKRKVFSHQKIIKSDFLMVYRYSIWQIISVFSIYILNYSLPFLFAYFNFSNEELGQYQFGLRLFFGMSGFFALVLVVAPKIMNFQPKLREKIHGICLFSVLVLSTVYLAAYYIINYVLIIFEKTEYIQSIEVMLYMFPSFIFMCYSNIMNTIFSNTKLYKLAQGAILMQSICFIFSAPLMISLYGKLGIIYSYTIAFLLGAVFTMLIYFKNKDLVTSIRL